MARRERHGAAASCPREQLTDRHTGDDVVTMATQSPDEVHRDRDHDRDPFGESIESQSNRRVVTQAAQDEGGSVRFAYHRRAVARRPGPLATGAANRMQL